MYEMFRNELIRKLYVKLDKDVLEEVLYALDNTAKDFNFSTKETGIVIYEENHFPKLIETYIGTKLIEGNSEKTLAQYALFLKMFFQDTQLRVEEVTKNDILCWLFEYRKHRTISDRTLDKYREYICRFFNWAADEGYIQVSPAKTINRIKYEIKEREPLTREELEYIREACNNLRETAMVEFLYSTGCRVSELSILKLSDVNFNTGTVKLFGKGKKHRVSYLNAKSKVALQRYLESRTDDSEYLFVSYRAPYTNIKKEAIEKEVRKIVSRTCIKNKKVTPHVFRHTTATHGLQNGMRIEAVRDMLGHVSMNTTTIYAKIDNESVRMEHLKCVI